MADYMLVFVQQKMSRLSLSSSASLTVHANDSGFLEFGILIFFLLCSVSPSTVCLQRASFMHMLRLFFPVFGECQRHL